MIKPHIFVTDKPLDRGSDIECLCGRIVRHATEHFFWIDAPSADYSEFVTTLNTCQDCLDELNLRTRSRNREYIYGLVPQQEGFDVERMLQEMVA